MNKKETIEALRDKVADIKWDLQSVLDNLDRIYHELESKTMTSEFQMTTDYIKDYIVNNLGCDVRHDLDTLLEAVQETSDTFDVDQEGLLKFMLANEPMTGTQLRIPDRIRQGYP